MPQPRDAVRPKLAERRCGEVARRDDRRGARRLYRKQVMDGVERWDAGAWWADFCHAVEDVGVRAGLTAVHGTARPRELVPCGHDVVLDRLKRRFGLERRTAVPAVWCRAEAVMPRGGATRSRGGRVSARGGPPHGRGSGPFEG
jgi:hypothetical protein